MFLAIFLLILGMVIPLLLNGQTFTNSIIGILCLSVSVAICLFSEYQATADSKGGVSRRIVGGLSVFVIVRLLMQMPSNYEFQTRFNQTTERLRERAKFKTVPSSSQHSSSLPLK